MTESKHLVKCPHPDCLTELKIGEDLPGGEYQCQCHTCTVKLTWATYLAGGRKPYLTLVDGKTEVSA